jgi:hypothetical protein
MTTRPDIRAEECLGWAFRSSFSVYLRNTDLPPLQGGGAFIPLPRVKTLG